MSNKKTFDEFEARRHKIKTYAKTKNVPLWKLAAMLRINDGNLSRKLRCLTEKQFKDYCGKIDDLSAERMVKDEI